MERLSNVSGVVSNRTSAPRHARTVRQIGILLFNGFAPQDAITVARAFELANALSRSLRSDSAIYHLRLLSAAGGMIASSSTMLVWTESIDACHHGEGFDALFIMGGAGAQHALCDARLVGWLRQAVPRCRMTLPIAEGRLLLDASNGTSALHARGPCDGPRHGAQRSAEAGAYANFVGPLRMALDVIQADLGAEIVNQIAVAVAPPAETQFTAIVRKNAEHFVSERIQASARWLLANASTQVVMREAARVAAMSERNFLRRFKIEIGVTPSEYLMYARLDMCCRLLVETNFPVDKIAERCGIGCGGRLSKLLRKHLSTTATAYRADARRMAGAPFALPVAQAAQSAQWVNAANAVKSDQTAPCAPETVASSGLEPQV
ncbi:transcriptional regulator GlxA family with amidase domain [Paraburkholderia bannensis]|uniref:Transcriptional regulator GlxA family with amidase domain n=1 Tax=Paraburkholderia bannensis TaxID=765414 RepID=A0A7W9TYR1_9BURK|nr:MULTISPECIES: helix-turn-helix domain-containing protein [Paraburkholderia]MBB3258631.1 transcriptional regulator GlxA family with amidase domain [Paraburkholderia sp. WP4_3_2]MBB6103644.1 transcriptional regulator GlxA family with amidase domain [Paraburkholderia bannensis]